MNTASDECIIEDLTSLVARDVGADEPDMSANNLSYVDIQDLFVAYQESSKGGQEEAVVETVAFVSPLDALKEIVLALDWEVSGSNLKKCQEEIEVLLERYQDDRYSTALLKMLSTIVKYLATEKGDAHPDSVKVLTSVYVCLEKIVSALDMDAVEKNKAVADEVVKFKTLRQKIACAAKGQKAAGGEDQDPRDTDALVSLKAMVLSVDWGEISQKRIDAFFAEIAALKKKWQADGTLVQGLEILRAYGQYIFVKKENAHPDSFNRLLASYNSLERVLASDHLTPGDKKDIISLELQKFIALKKEITSETAHPPVADSHDAATAEGATRRQVGRGQAASFLTAVDTRLDDFFAEKDATQAAALQVAELPHYESTAFEDEGAPAAMFDDGALPEGAPAAMMDDGALAMAVEDEGPAMFMEEASAPAEDLGVSIMQEEALIHAEEGSPAQTSDDTMPSRPENGGGEEFMAEVFSQAEEPGRSETQDKTISLAEEIGQEELSEIVTEHDLTITVDQDLDSDRVSKEAAVAEELFVAGIVSEQAEPSAPASPPPPWLDDLDRVISGLKGECSDAAVAALRHQIALVVSTQQVFPPVAGIALDLLAAVSAQLAAMAEGDRAEGAALLESLGARLTTNGAGTDASALAAIQSLVHDYVVWQSAALRPAPEPPPTVQTTTQAPPAAAEQQAAKAPALPEEASSEPTSTPKERPRRDHTAPAGTFFEKILQLFKK